MVPKSETQGILNIWTAQNEEFGAETLKKERLARWGLVYGCWELQQSACRICDRKQHVSGDNNHEASL